jgi:tetratricopeptide (TPR) repeat protein
VRLNRGFLYFARHKYQEANNEYSYVLSQDPNNVTAINNKSICCLFLKNTKQSIEIIENSFRNLIENSNLNENLISNLIILYEIEIENVLDKKRMLKNIFQSFLSDDFIIPSLNNILK